MEWKTAATATAPPDAAILDGLKGCRLPLRNAVGITVSVFDATVPPNKPELLAAADEKVAATDEDHEMGPPMSPEERHKQVIDIWNETARQAGDAMAENFPKLVQPHLHDGVLRRLSR